MNTLILTFGIADPNPDNFTVEFIDLFPGQSLLKTYVRPLSIKEILNQVKYISKEMIEQRHSQERLKMIHYLDQFISPN